MVSTGLSDVIGSWKIIAISLPRISRIWSGLSVRRSRPSNMTVPRFNLAGRARYQTHQRKRANTFAAAALADDAECLTFFQCERYAVDREDGPFLCIKPDYEVFDIQ